MRSPPAPCSATSGSRPSHGGELTGAVAAGLVDREPVVTWARCSPARRARTQLRRGDHAVRLHRARDPGSGDRGRRVRGLAGGRRAGADDRAVDELSRWTTRGAGNVNSCRRSSSGPSSGMSPTPRRPSGSRPTRGARSRSSVAQRAPSRSAVGTMALSCSVNSSRQSRRSTRFTRRRAPVADARVSVSRRASSGLCPPAGRSTSSGGHAGSPARTPPYTLDIDEHPEGTGVDALHALGLRMREQAGAHRPHLLLLIGDQVYADEVSPVTLEEIRAKRDIREPPGEEVNDVEEYTMLYRESWGDPPVRWLLSTIPSAMMFDDHDVHDDWNTSEAWIEDMRATDWWHERILSGLCDVLDLPAHRQPVTHRARRQPAVGGDPGERRRRGAAARFAEDADRDQGGALWAFSRRIGNARLVVLDGREGRVLQDGRREMMDDGEWAWFETRWTTTLTMCSSPGRFRCCSHRRCTGSRPGTRRSATAPGAGGRPEAEKLRRGLDLEHWAAFQDRSTVWSRWSAEVAAGKRGAAPASIVMLGGDVHQCYLSGCASRRPRGQQLGLPGGLLAVSQPTGAAGAADGPAGATFTALRATGPRAGALGRRPRTGHPLGRRPGPNVAQPARMAADRRPALELTIETTPASHAPVLEPVLQLRIA